MDNFIGFECPVCHSQAIYKYGHIKSGKQRFKCLICGRQFILGITQSKIHNRPSCPKCGLKMHLYMRDAKVFRFRCSDYPDCKTYEKILVVKEEITANELLCS